MPAHKVKVVLAYDVDGTLHSGTENHITAALGLDPVRFWNRVNELTADGYARPLGWLRALMEIDGKHSLTREKIRSFAKELAFFPGVCDPGEISLFERLRIEAQKPNNEQVAVYLKQVVISSGLTDLIHWSPIGTQVDEIYATDVDYGPDGRIAWIKSSMPSVQKPRFLFEIAKGISKKEGQQDQDGVNRLRKYDTPLSQFGFVGDGFTDVEAWTVLAIHHSPHRFAVYDPTRLGAKEKAQQFLNDRRVTSYFAADYRKESDLYRALLNAINEIVCFNLRQNGLL